MLVEVTQRAKEAETTKNHVQLAKDRAQRLVDVIAADKTVAEAKLEDARPALEEAEAALNTIKPAHIGLLITLQGYMAILIGVLFVLNSHCP